MFVEVVTVSDVHVTVVNIVHVAVVLYRFMATVFAVLVVVSGVLYAGIFAAFCQTVIIDMAFMRGVKMAIMNVVGMGRMLGGFMAALGSVHVVVRRVLRVGCIYGDRSYRSRFSYRGSFRFFLRAGAPG